MYVLLIIVAALICVVGFIVTISAGKEVDATIQKRKEEGNKVGNEQQRSRSYESSFSNVRWILLIYGAAFFLGILALVIFLNY